MEIQLRQLQKSFKFFQENIEQVGHFRQCKEIYNDVMIRDSVGYEYLKKRNVSICRGHELAYALYIARSCSYEYLLS